MKPTMTMQDVFPEKGKSLKRGKYKVNTNGRTKS